MKQILCKTYRWVLFIALIVGALVGTRSTHAAINVTATVLPPPPNDQAVILSPTNNSHVSVTPLVLSGTCGPGLLVRAYNNNRLAGSMTCSPDGTFVMNIILESGTNVLYTRNYDAFEQAGPDSASITVVVDQPTVAVAQKLIEQLQSEPDKPTFSDHSIFSQTPLDEIAKVLNLDKSQTTGGSSSTVTVLVNVGFGITIVGLALILFIL